MLLRSSGVARVGRALAVLGAAWGAAGAWTCAADGAQGAPVVPTLEAADPREESDIAEFMRDEPRPVVRGGGGRGA
jgi:hypothetical protein